MCCYSGIRLPITNAETLWHHTENKAQWETRSLITGSLWTKPSSICCRKKSILNGCMYFVSDLFRSQAFSCTDCFLEQERSYKVLKSVIVSHTCKAKRITKQEEVKVCMLLCNRKLVSITIWVMCSKLKAPWNSHLFTLKQVSEGSIFFLSFCCWGSDIYQSKSNIYRTFLSKQPWQNTQKHSKYDTNQKHTPGYQVDIITGKLLWYRIRG